MLGGQSYVEAQDGLTVKEWLKKQEASRLHIIQVLNTCLKGTTKLVTGSQSSKKITQGSQLYTLSAYTRRKTDIGILNDGLQPLTNLCQKKGWPSLVIGFCVCVHFS